jgi:hypothetical protein
MSPCCPQPDRVTHALLSHLSSSLCSSSRVCFFLLLCLHLSFSETLAVCITHIHSSTRGLSLSNTSAKNVSITLRRCLARPVMPGLEPAPLALVAHRLPHTPPRRRPPSLRPSSSSWGLLRLCRRRGFLRPTNQMSPNGSARRVMASAGWNSKASIEGSRGTHSTCQDTRGQEPS